MLGLLLAQSVTPVVGMWVPLVSVLVPVMAWCIWLSTGLTTLKRESHRLIWMHENADEAGFGTVQLRAQHEAERAEMKAMMENNTRAMREIAHYVKYAIEETTGKPAPPPRPAVLEGS